MTLGSPRFRCDYFGAVEQDDGSVSACFGDVIALVTDLLPEGSDRLAHSLAVGHRTRGVAERAAGVDIETVVAAGFLHDVGYADVAVDSGLHQLDGARHLRAVGYDHAVCRLVAHHSFAWIEARNRGLLDEMMTEFPEPDGELARLLDLVTYCDMTISATGTPVSVDERLAAIFARYDPTDVVWRSMREADPLVRTVVSDVEVAIR